ncbi:DUF5336 domain-containing protein [Amycolatopsis sp. H20-H5]|uniref:DUF5336 domain-containing protein n=1 Tax=Amycolatopsis sp. H20-H5 TaxID=3046309 RepID=UPI002DB9E06B|nr:DUF5336 domain-containing protein [Amycolatopsis sp. H20-H5]MEC3982439.1 DUF5336 domain-containing protein [Amycolatopsis sp. H20-H5]
MTFPSGGPGYPQQGGPQHPQQPAPGTGGFPQQGPPAPASPSSLPPIGMLLALGVTVLGVVQYFLGFSDEASGADWVTTFLLAGGLLAALPLLPSGPKTLPFAALLSVLGGLLALDTVIGIPKQSSTPGIVVVILILGLLQLLVAVAALLFEHGVLKMPPPKAAPQNPYGQQYGQQGPQNPPGPFGQQGGQSPYGQQPGQYAPPATPPPGQQATTYAPQQGQFFQQPPAEPGSQNPGTPPGGFGGNSPS